MIATASRGSAVAEDRKQGRPGGRKPSVKFSLRLSPALGKEFLDFLNSLEPRPSKNAVIEAAIRHYLAYRKGKQS